MSHSFLEFEFHPPSERLAFTWSVSLGVGVAASVVALLLFLLLLGCWWYKKHHVEPPAPPAAAPTDVEMQLLAATTIGPAGVDPALRRWIPQVVFHSASSMVLPCQ